MTTAWPKSLNADCMGPLGFPMKTKAARLLEGFLKDAPRENGEVPVIRVPHYNDAIRATTDDTDGWWDVSWVTKASPDHVKDVVLVQGMDDSVFRMNPIVTLNHNYGMEAIGRNVWMKRDRDDRGVEGIVGKSTYDRKPPEWDAHVHGQWLPERVFLLIRSKLLNGKSIGFIPGGRGPRMPTQQEIDEHPDWQGAKIYDSWRLVEYGVCVKPVHFSTLVTEVKKSLDEPGLKMLEAFGIEVKAETTNVQQDPAPVVVPVTPDAPAVVHDGPLATPSVPVAEAPTPKTDPEPPPVERTARYTRVEDTARVLKSRLNPDRHGGVVRQAIEDAIGRKTGRI